MMARDAPFGEDLARAYGIVWEDDLFAPADEDGRSTTDVEAFFGPQTEWLRDNLPAKGVILETARNGHGGTGGERDHRRNGRAAHIIVEFLSGPASSLRPQPKSCSR